jgi:hypothetical protein
MMEMARAIASSTIHYPRFRNAMND